MQMYCEQLSREQLSLTAFDLLRAVRTVHPIKRKHTLCALIEQKIERDFRRDLSELAINQPITTNVLTTTVCF